MEIKHPPIILSRDLQNQLIEYSNQQNTPVSVIIETLVHDLLNQRTPTQIDETRLIITKPVMKKRGLI